MHALYDHKVAIKTRFKPNGENFFIWQNLKFEKNGCTMYMYRYKD